MIPDEDELLVLQLAQLGGRGAAWTARRLRKDVYEVQKILSGSIVEVFAAVTSLLESVGTVVARTGPADGQAVVCGVVGSGAMNLNPAVLTVNMASAADGGTILRIRGAAKEGVIKQRAGEKAAKRFEAMLD